MPLYIFIIYICLFLIFLQLHQPNKPNKTITVGSIVDYWTKESVLDISTRHKTGPVTTIFDIDNLSLYDQLMIIDGMDVVVYGSFIRFPSSEDRWTAKCPFLCTDQVAPNKRYAFVPGTIVNGTRKKIARLSAQFKQITREARQNFEKTVVAGVSIHYSHYIYEFTYFKLLFIHSCVNPKQKKKEQSLKQKMKKLDDLKKKKLSDSKLSTSVGKMDGVGKKDGADVCDSVAAAACTDTYQKQYYGDSNEDNDIVS